MAIKDAERIQAVYAEGMRLMQSGQGEAALKKFADVLNANPRIAEAHFQIARLFLGVDRLEPALHHAKEAARLRPKVNDVWRLWSEIVMVLSDVDERDVFRAAVDRSELSSGDIANLKTSVDLTGRSAPHVGDLPQTVVDTFLPLLEAGRFADAADVLRGVSVRYPKSAMAHNGLAVAMLGMGRAAEALPMSETALKLDPNYIEARLNQARILIALRRAPEGIRQCNLALRAAPGFVQALLCRAECNKALRRMPETQADLRRALKLDRKAERASRMLLSILMDCAEYFAAEDLIEATWKPGKRPLAVDMHRAKILAETQRTKEALEAYTDIVDTHPDADVSFELGDLNQSLGNFDAAQEHFDAAISAHPDRGDIFRLYLTSKKIELDDPLVAHMQSKFEDPKVDPSSRAHFAFALGKVHEDHKAYDAVFDYIHPANALKKSTESYTFTRRQAMDRRIMQAMQRVDWSNPPMRTGNTQAPIFVTGMPRSGTTLVEQIISSHSSVAGAGEVQRITRMALGLLGGEEMPLRPPSHVPAAAMDAFADTYWSGLQRLNLEGSFVTDKTVQTHVFLGLIKIAMPQSRFIVVKRDPRDNLLSMYKNVFPDGAHLYSYDLTWLAQMYKMSEAFCDFWREVRPDWIYEIQYEDLVSNPEEETRKLIDACGLEWEDACLNFHENDRRVNTLSLYQVRQPMYKSSTRAWERYGDALDELFEALGPEYAPAAE